MKKLTKGILLKGRKLATANKTAERLDETHRFRLEHYASCKAHSETKQLKSAFLCMILGYLECLQDNEIIDHKTYMLLSSYYDEMSIIMETSPQCVKG